MLERPILHVLDHALPESSGYAVRSHNLLRHLHAAGVPLIALTASSPAGAAGEEVVDGVRYVRLPLHSQGESQTPSSVAKRIFSLSRRLLPEIRARGVVLVHAHSPATNGIAALWAARRTDVPIVYEMRALWEDARVARGLNSDRSMRYRAARALETWVVRRVDSVATISLGLVGEVVARGVKPERVFHVPNAIDSRLFQPAAADAELLARHQLTGAIVFGYIGYFFAYEGIADLVRAFATVRREMAQSRLLLVGDGDGSEELHALARQLGIESAVVFTGRVPHELVQRYYSLCDVLVYPRRSGRTTDLVTPLKPLEAMAMGKPIVVSSVGGLAELVRPGETGLVSPPSDPEGLARVLVAISSDAALRARLGENARRFAAEECDWARVAGVYQDTYRRLLGLPAGGRQPG